VKKLQPEKPPIDLSGFIFEEISESRLLERRGGILDMDRGEWEGFGHKHPIEKTGF